MSRNKKKARSNAKLRKLGKKSDPKHSADSGTGGAGSDRVVLERKARESLAQGQNRRAFDGFKRLFKLDPDTYRADLVVTATLYFRDTLGQSKLREARLVLDSLEGIASAPNIAAMGLRLAFLTGDGDAVVALADEILRAPDSLAEDRRAAADGLVTLPPERREGVVWEELRLLDQALADASAGRLAEAGKPLRGIPRQSPFAHWRLFFKAICAHAEGDASTTAKALASLDGACLALAKAWVAPDLESLATAVSLRGESVLAAELPDLLRSDAKGNHGVIFVRLCDRYPGFPTIAGGIAATLTDYLVAGISRFEMSDHTFALFKRKVVGGKLAPLPRFMIERSVCNLLMRYDDFSLADAAVVTRLVDLAKTAFPDNFEAVSSHLLSDCAVRVVAGCDKRKLGSILRLTIKWLELSTKLCPERVAPALTLIEHYLMAGQVEKCDAAMEAALARFGGKPGVIFKAGSVAFRRGRYAEAQAIFLDLLSRDPLNDGVRGEVIGAALINCRTSLERGDRDEAVLAADVAIAQARASIAFILRPDKVMLQCARCFEDHLGETAARPYYERAAQSMSADTYAFDRYVLSLGRVPTDNRARKLRRPSKTFFKAANFADALEMEGFLVAVKEELPAAAVNNAESMLARYIEAALLRDPDWRVNVIPLVRLLIAGEEKEFLLDELLSAAEARALRDPITRMIDAAGYAMYAKPEDVDELKKLRHAQQKLREEGFTEAVKLCEEIAVIYEREMKRGGGGSSDWGDNFFDEPSLAEIQAALAGLAGRGTRKKTAKKATAKKKAAAKKKSPQKKKTTPKKKAAAKKQTTAPSGSKTPPASPEPEDDLQLDLPF